VTKPNASSQEERQHFDKTRRSEVIDAHIDTFFLLFVETEDPRFYLHHHAAFCYDILQKYVTISTINT
jgi:hypothetical protein